MRGLKGCGTLLSTNTCCDCKKTCVVGNIRLFRVILACSPRISCLISS